MALDAMLELLDGVAVRIAGTSWIPENECLRLDRRLGRLFEDPVFPVRAREKLSTARSWLAVYPDDGQCLEEGGRSQVRRELIEELDALRRLITDITRPPAQR